MVEKPRHLENRIVSTPFLLAKPKHRPYNKTEVIDMDEKALMDAIREIMREELEPVKDDIKDLKKDVKDLRAGQKNIIKRLTKIEAVQEYLIEHVDDLEQKDPA